MVKSPNWCSNNIIIQGNEEDIKKLKEFVSAEDSDFSFQSIVPMPEELRDTTAPNVNLEQARQMVEKYGYPDWYTWAADNWGTKWDTLETHMVDGPNMVNYTFETAWGSPVPVMEALARRFPELHISIEYDEPGMDFWGKLAWHNYELVLEEDGPSQQHEDFLDEEEWLDEFDAEEDVPDENF